MWIFQLTSRERNLGRALDLHESYQSYVQNLSAKLNVIKDKLDTLVQTDDLHEIGFNIQEHQVLF